MKPLSCLWLPAMLGEMTARGTGRAESSMKSKQQPWNNGQAKELPYPEPSLCADSSIKPPASCHSAGLSRDNTDPLSPVTLSLLLTLSVRSAPADFTPFPLFLYCLYISRPSREIRTVDKEETKVAGDIFYFILSPLKILTNRFLWDAEESESPAGEWRRIDPSLSRNPELWHVMIRNGTNSSPDKTVRLGPCLLFNPLSSKEPHMVVSSGLLLYIVV